MREIFVAIPTIPIRMGGNDYSERSVSRSCAQANSAHPSLLAVVIALAMVPAATFAVRADYVRLLHDDVEAAQARVDLVQQATSDLCISYYIIDRDQVPFGFLALLRDAARRGVAVRMLVDGANNRIPAAVQAHLLAEGVAIREYHPPVWYRVGWFTRRMHDKLLISDCRQFITGGRNIKDEYFGHDPCENFRDLDAYCRGCTAGDARRYFMCVWNSDDVKPTRLKDRKKSECSDDPILKELEVCSSQALSTAELLLDEAMTLLQSCDSLVWSSGFDWSAGLCDVPNVALIHNDICPHRHNQREVRKTIHGLIDEAQRCVLIETPYLTLTDRMQKCLHQARKRGVQVVVVTNSLASTNHVIAQAAYVNQKRWFLDRGIEVWEYAGPLRLHSKAAVIDGSLALVGTYNFDPLSEVMNLEVMLAVEDPTFVAAVLEQIHLDRRNSWKLNDDGTVGRTGTPYPRCDEDRIKELNRLRHVAPLINRFL